MERQLSFQYIVEKIADAVRAVDDSGIAHASFQPGVGPYSEPALTKLIAAHLDAIPSLNGRVSVQRQPDLLIRDAWAIELKIARPFGDNGKEAENWSVNLLHPYPGNVSVYADLLKLRSSAAAPGRASIVIGYEHDQVKISLDPLLCAFEAIAARMLPFQLSKRVEIRRSGLRHPVHQVMRVIGWEIL